MPQFGLAAIASLATLSVMLPTQVTAQVTDEQELTRVTEPPSTSLRVASELGGGLLGALGAGVVGLAAGVGIHAACEADKFDSEIGCEFYAAIGGSFVVGAVALFTVPAGVLLAGDARGGDGSYWLTVLGTFAGGVVGIGTAAMMVDWDPSSSAGRAFLFGGQILAVVGGPVMGAIIGYELSSPRRTGLGTGPTVSASVGPLGADGLAVALRGEF